MNKHPGGRPTKLTPEIQESIVQAVRAGNYLEVAAAFAGIHRSTLFDWMRRGARERDRRLKGEPPNVEEDAFVEFSDAIQKALAEAEVRDVAIIGKAAQEHWQAAAWRLERKFPARWGRKDRFEHDAKVTVGVDDKLERAVIENPKLSELATEFFAELASGGLGEDDAAGTGEASEPEDMADA